MEAMNHKRGWLLYLVGAVVTVLGLCGSNLDYFPALRLLITPFYARAQSGFDTLLKNQELLPADRGFSELAQIAAKRVTHNRQQETGPPIQKFTVGQPMLGFGPNNTGGMYHPIVMEFPSDQTVRGDVEDFRSDLAEVKANSAARYSLAVALAGIFIGFIGFLRKGST
jgi:hypothetical protein